MRFNKLLYLGYVAGFFCITSCSDDLSCEQFKNGEFKLGTNSDIRILRDGNTQKEYSNNPNENFTDEYRINWLDDCSYSATLVNTNDQKGHELNIGDSMLVRIVKTAGKRYEWEGHVDGEIKKGIMIKLD